MASAGVDGVDLRAQAKRGASPEDPPAEAGTATNGRALSEAEHEGSSPETGPAGNQRQTRGRPTRPSALSSRAVAREWNDLFVVGGEPIAVAQPEAVEEPGEGRPKRRFFKRLRENLSKTRQALGAEIQATMFERLDDEAFERLEEALIYADVGAPTTAAIVERLEGEAAGGELESGEDLTRRLRELLAETARVGDDRIDLGAQPTVILMVGVNGTGKTTTIGKVAWHLQRELGRSVLLAAGDTFRAAAAEQLEVWAERAGCDIVRGREGSDPGSVIYDAIEAAKARGHDVVLCDTAGRLHTQQHLMDELTKVRKVIAARIPEAPHHTLLTIDATTGQNGLRQALMFREAVPIDGIVLTKLDGTAKGGIALAIAQELGVPVQLIGIGESIEDLRPFDPADFAAAILD
ncbi:MAG: signal recognition particle-docking protein FtsY [Solirubrobacterales bacterium]|nr:signal recognition particle-docking protein FtsY [Solirubrobacterales bacterium]